MKIVIKILMECRGNLQLQKIKTIIDQMVFSEKLVIMNNTLPLYFSSLMFFVDAETGI